MADGFSLDAENAETLKHLQVQRMRAELRALRQEKWMSYLAVASVTLLVLCVVVALSVAIVRALAGHHP
jgi:t-SNARE complex subunit (syntaxin)